MGRPGRKLTALGETLTIDGWVSKLREELGSGITANLIRSRLHYGWSVEAALLTPTRKYNKSGNFGRAKKF